MHNLDHNKFHRYDCVVPCIPGHLRCFYVILLVGVGESHYLLWAVYIQPIHSQLILVLILIVRDVL